MSILKVSKVNAFLVSLMAMAILLCCGSQAQAAQDGDFTYDVKEGEAQVTGFTGAGEDVTIPDTLGGYPVTSIGGYAFYLCSGITSISIPQGVASIGEAAFAYCPDLTAITVAVDNLHYAGINGVLFNKEGTILIACPRGLTSISIPQEVTSIGSYAFYKCSGITSISIPQGVTCIGDGAFADCPGLTAITVATDNLNYAGINGVLFNKEGTILIACPGSLTSIGIPQEVTSIGSFAFYGCAGLTSISIPQGVTSIGDDVFSGCTGLTSMSIPQGVTSIGDGVFYDCTGLTSISIPQSVTSIGNWAFYDCEALTSISLPQVTNIGSEAFIGCTGLTSISLPQVTNIGNWAFAGCTGLTSISLPQSVTNIGKWAFYYCDALTSITINSATTVIYDSPDTISDTAKIIGYDPSTAKDYAAKYGRTFEAIDPATLCETHVELGTSPDSNKEAGLFIGLSNLHDSTGTGLTDLGISGYSIEIEFDPAKAGIFGVTNMVQIPNFSISLDVVGQKATINFTGNITGDFERLLFVPLRLSGSTEDITTLTIKFLSIGAENLEIPEPITLSFQRGNILNDGTTSTDIEDAVAGLQYLAGMRDMGLDDGQVNVVNMASILPVNKPSVKDVIALMQNLVGIRDDFFQLAG